MGQIPAETLTCFGWQRDSTVEEAYQDLTAARLLQLADRFRFDLPHALASDGKNLAHLFERVRVAVGQP